MNKNVLRILLIVIILLGVGVTMSIGFNDITGHWAESWIKYISKSNIINGYPDGTFKPDDQVTVGEYIKMISMLYYDLYEYKEPTNGEHWALQYVRLMQKNHTIPYEKYETKEELDRIITRNEMATISIKALIKLNSGSEKVEIVTDLVNKDIFSDISNLTKDEKNYINTLVKYEIINGFEDGTFKPNDGLTRAQAAKVIYLIRNF